MSNTEVELDRSATSAEACFEEMLEHARAICARRGERLTDLRQTVLELVCRSATPVKAYEILDALKAVGRSSAPPTAYRTLDFLQCLGLVHKIERINAYVGCSHPLKSHSGMFLICSGCGNAVELADNGLASRIDAQAEKAGFKVHDRTVEVSGVCDACRH
ncbi:MAG: Fur family transcriptional regulator [Pseudomonadota bacterium]